ncbi:glycosyltransferase family 2 protein [Syntrophobacter fumaroxidans]|uniref:Glycosyl transferase, family 2 n=1 Tax=Syntrophobacter fumaroxidans (strain DSM 10017 / MPOB) TaxID=335543 RepID=A0LNL9_SYNFM|nr:glycosyltransferase family A protein [Syntrophobacter fumaroxidans]ABK19021.1 glycosyl transferase, family 2 [Syntrophobacter fumaroxidans MPOB]
MRYPLISIVIPCFNCADFVGQAIQSALSQTYTNREIIVIDDGSEDESLRVIQSFRNEIQWQSGENRGACAARNAGLELARGEFVQFLDADDALFPDKLARTVPVAVRERVDSVVCDVHVVGLTGKTQVWRPTCDADPVAAALGMEVGPAGHLLRTGLVRDTGGFREELPCAQERDLHLRFACAGGTLAYVPEVLARLLKRPRSLSSNTIRVLDQYARILQPAFEHLELAGKLNDHRRRAFAGFMARAGRSYLAFGERSKANIYFNIARRFHHHGGVDEAYGKLGGSICRIVGPFWTDRLIRIRRRTTTLLISPNG